MAFDWLNFTGIPAKGDPAEANQDLTPMTSSIASKNCLMLPESHVNCQDFHHIIKSEFIRRVWIVNIFNSHNLTKYFQFLHPKTQHSIFQSNTLTLCTQGRNNGQILTKKQLHCKLVFLVFYFSRSLSLYNFHCWMCKLACQLQTAFVIKMFARVV